jgi:hypothetical protein
MTVIQAFNCPQPPFSVHYLQRGKEGGREKQGHRDGGVKRKEADGGEGERRGSREGGMGIESGREGDREREGRGKEEGTEEGLAQGLKVVFL